MIDYLEIIFKILEAGLQQVESVAVAILGYIIDFIRSSGIIWVLFAIQLTLIVIDFVLEQDGLGGVVAFIRLLLLYVVVTTLLVGNNWKDLTVGFLRMTNSVMTGAVAAAGNATAGGGIASSDNPAEVLSSMASALKRQIDKVTDELDKHMTSTEKQLKDRINNLEGASLGSVAP
ncbi:MAG: hypothetical protein N2690_00200 [Rhodocyclaceae bacterium]|nr:hypothetical protein [Rhodocyclaceae bacterium]